jgi:hypothetical protein
VHEIASDGEPSSLLKMFCPVASLFKMLWCTCMALPGSPGNRLGHEGGVHVVAQRRLAHRTLEEKHLVGQAQWLGMERS